MDEAVKEVAEVVDAIKSGRIPPPNKAQTIVICEKVLELGVMLSEARCELKEAQSLLDRIGDALEDVDYKGDYADGVKALLLRSNDRVEGRDAALSRRVPSHDGLEGNDTGRHE